MLKKLTENIADVRNMLGIQGQNGNWNADSYMLGMYNGLEAAVATMEKRDPQYRSFKKSDTDGTGIIAVDLDGTLAEIHYDEQGNYIKEYQPGLVGRPIKSMVDRVKEWLATGKNVAIFTARASREDEIEPIKAWCKRNIGTVLEVTNKKSPNMIQFWDDRAVAMEPNTGIIMGRSHESD